LAGLRDPAAVARLPADEQQVCQQFWAEVEALLNAIDSGDQVGETKSSPFTEK
jgi:hypothetical protein